MSKSVLAADRVHESTLSDVIKIAVLAVGGQGGGVLTQWIADLAIKGGYDVQTTSVAGVAQRTGATIYYIEMAPRCQRPAVFAQSPVPGDVDIMIAAELMEAGRSVMRGFVTPDKTTLIASTHRILAVCEKQVPGDGRADEGPVLEEMQKACAQSVCFDMESIAVQSGSVISASLFGGLAKSRALPFETDLFEDVIRASGRGVEQSLHAFRETLMFDDTKRPPVDVEKPQSITAYGPEKLLAEWHILRQRVEELDPDCRSIVMAGLQKTIDYQDVQYGHEYLDYVLCWYVIDEGEKGYILTKTAAKYIANAMCYDDIMRVADLKIRASRDQRLRHEQGVDNMAIVQVSEYFHPRAQEICGTMPASWGHWFENSPKAFQWLDRIVNKGRRIRTDRIGGFLLLKMVGFLKKYRRRFLRHQHEQVHLNRLQSAAKKAVVSDYQLAVEILNCQRLVKGYSDTHLKGHSKFSKIMDALALLEGRNDAAKWVKRLRETALRNEDIKKLDDAIKTIASFVV